MKYVKPILVLAVFLISMSATADHSIQYDIGVDGITCPFCVASSEKALAKIEGIQAISTNLETGIMTVCAEPYVELNEGELRNLYLEQGFTYRSLSKTKGCTLSDVSHDEHKNHGANKDERF